MRTTTVEHLTEAELTDLTDGTDRTDRTAPDGPVAEAGLGALGTERGNLPLESVDVRSRVTGLAVRTDLAQGFRNPYDVPLEATYIFPLPDRAAVTRLLMEAGDRVVEGVVKERFEARAEYDQAIATGQRASIAEEERPGVFTMRVGNILPGERVVIRLTLSGRLPFEDGEATYRFPLVVAPRYIPGAALPGEQVGGGTAEDTDQVPDASRITPPVLLPGFPNPVRLTAEVDVAPAGLPLTTVRSSLHGVEVVDREDGGFVVSMRPGERANRDFVLRFGYGAEDVVSTSLAVCHDFGEDEDPRGAGGPAEGTFLLTVLPPAAAAAAMRPRDVVLVLDRSGSMEGWKMAAARRAAARIVDTLTTADRFAVLAFDSVVEGPPALPSGLVAAGDRNRFRAVEYLATLTARGGTELEQPLDQAVRLLGGGDRDRVVVLVTDGQVGGEDQILARLAPRLAGIRVHTIGIDQAVNAAFLRRLADAGGGRCELVESEDRLDEAMEHIHRRIGSPVVTGVSVAGEGLAVTAGSVEPSRLPDLFAGAPLVVTGRFTGAAAGSVVVTGTAADGSAWRTRVEAVATADAGFASLWARGRIRDLEDRYVAGTGDMGAVEREIVATSVRFSVLSRFTAFLAVDRRVVTDGMPVKQVTQPVDLPAGWSADMASAFRAAPAVSAAPPPPAPRMAWPDSAAGGVAGEARKMSKSRGLGFAPPAGMPPVPPPQAMPAPAAPAGPGGGGGFGAAPAAVSWERADLEKKTAPAPGEADVFAALEPAAEPQPDTGAAPMRRLRKPAQLTAADARTAAAELLEALRAAEGESGVERVAALGRLAGELVRLRDRLTDDRQRKAVEDLLQVLVGGESGAGDLEARWTAAVTALETLSTEAPARRAFWKR